jgi:DNA (cytosine-5)-methyltransferase 1
MSARLIKAADLFCGAGGTSTGLVRAARALGLELDLLAVNHWQVAVDTHTRNHPWARHLCADLASVDPNKAVGGDRLNLLVASPECTHHSVARGGKPCSDQSRASAWHVLHWAERLRIDNILIENVREFESWGPLTKAGRPEKRRKGETFRAFLQALRSLGYTVDHRVLNAADYGDATTRQRLFVQARRSGKMTWPNASHSRKADLFALKPWRAAREVIDWTLKGESIFNRKRPLSPRTIERIKAGLRKFGGGAFIVPQMSGGTVRGVEEPLPTITTTSRGVAMVEPFILPHEGYYRGNSAKSLDNPLPTITASHSHALVEPFLIEYHGNHAGREDSAQRVRSVDRPLPSQDTSNRFGLCEPFVTKYYGTGTARPVSEPLDTVTTKDRFALVEPKREGARLDIRFRMLQPHELAAAMGFEGYEFEGTKTEQVRQIGNAVCVHVAQALCRNILEAT